MISSIGVSVYILIDTFFISKGMGADGLAALNLSLPVFSFLNGFGLMLGMGMKGAALATCIAPFVSLSIMSIHFLTGWNAFRLRLMLPSWSMLKEIVSLGLHAFFTEVSGGLVIFAFNSVIHRLMGNAGIAAYGVIANIAIVFTALFIGLSSGVQPLMCRYHGRRDEKAIKYLLRLSLITSVIAAIFSYVLLFVHTAPVVRAFNSSGDVSMREIAENGLRIYFLYMPFMGVNAIMSVYFSSEEKPHIAQMISLLRGTLLVIPAVFAAYLLRSIGLVWLAVPMSELLTVITAWCIYFFIRRKSTVSAGLPKPARRLSADM